MRAGFTPFPISPRNSPTATSHLLTQTGTKFLYVSRDRATRDIISSVLEMHTDNLKILEMPTFDDLYDPVDHLPLNQDMLPPMITPDMLSPCLILHSSGTTAFPKPITYNHRDLLQFARLRSTGEMGVPGQVHAMHAIPMFRQSSKTYLSRGLLKSDAMGMTSMSRAAVAAMVIAVFEPRDPPMTPSPDELLKGVSREECTILPCVPSFLEVNWASDSHAVEILKSLKAVIFAGGPLSHIVGDYLTSQGVHLYTVYGGTEFGTVSMMLPKEPLGDKWEYFYLSPSIHIPDVFELIVAETCEYMPILASCQIDGKKAYETRDLLIRHPRDPDLWKVYGRCDDQIMLSTEKTNPGPIEYIFCKDPRILSAVMFGRGRLFNGIILELARPYRFDSSNKELLAAFRTSISALMILVANSTKTFDYTLKGTPRRHSILAAHQAEIDTAYWDLDSVVNWTQDLLQCVLRCPVPCDTDVFWLGCDRYSQGLRIRSMLASVLQNVRGADHVVQLPQDFVYRHPAAQAMAKVLVSRTTDYPSVSLSKTAEMTDLVVLLTGTTGSLGSHILYYLHQCKDVRRIYALNRGDPDDLDSLRCRQENALKIRGITPEILRDGKVVLIPSDLASDNFGLKPSLSGEASGALQLQNSVDLIIHTAWPVNFNYTLASYVRSLEGLQNMVNFARYTTSEWSPRFIFTSSVSVLKNWSGGSPVPEIALPNPEVAVGLGYAESKWTAEQILAEAADHGLSVSIFRIGQLSGSPNGYWNRNEWFPSVVQAANVLGCLPGIDTQLFHWLPVDSAAAVIVEMRSNLHRYVHLANPRPVPSTLVLQEDWFSRLNTVPKDTATDARGRLDRVSTLLNGIMEDIAGRPIEMDLKNGLRCSETLRNSPQISRQDVSWWLRSWGAYKG
ncbi:hypothetical protein BKA82DRAFT_4205845 [Pisolithus tinctorius]|nr:hypothetical protein BKA82DRAFT_4205845 [Pisolithus tinctorius]